MCRVCLNDRLECSCNDCECGAKCGEFKQCKQCFVELKKSKKMNKQIEDNDLEDDDHGFEDWFVSKSDQQMFDDEMDRRISLMFDD